MKRFTENAIPEYRQMVKGELMLVTEGEYSDYGVNEVLRVLRNFDWAVVADVWNIKERPFEHDEEDHWKIKNAGDHYKINFIAWLIRQGYAEQVNYKTFHIGSHGEFEPYMGGPHI